MRAGEARFGFPGVAAGPGWGHGVEDQRVPDRGDGTYLNPILSGGHPDPTVSGMAAAATCWPRKAPIR
jgi:hypothetical protein